MREFEVKLKSGFSMLVWASDTKSAIEFLNTQGFETTDEIKPTGRIEFDWIGNGD